MNAFARTTSRSWLVALAIVAAVMATTRADAGRNTGVADIFVNSQSDAGDANRGDGFCRTTAPGAVCSLRAAMQEADALNGVSIITLPAGTYVLTITGKNELGGLTGDLNIGPGRDITINGAGAATTIIDANAIDRAFEGSGGSLTLNDVTVQNGRTAPGNGGCFNMGAGSRLTLNRSVVKGCDSGASAGGGIIISGVGSSASTLTLTETTITQNRSTGNGGGVVLDPGVTATMNRSTISGNSASNGAGIMIFANPASTMTLTNTTISGNTATNTGGAFYFSGGASGAAATLRNVTLASNTSGRDGAVAFSGTGVYQVRNSLIANNTGAAPANCAGFGLVTNLGNNLEFPGTTCGFGLASDRLLDPRLDPLGAHGGPTATHAFSPGSPAVGGADSATCAAAPVGGVDQRGIARSGGCDIGAYEFDAATAATLDRTALAFAATSNGTALTAQTPAQPVRLRKGSAGTVTWTASSDKPWLTVSPASGSGPALFSVAVKFDATLPSSGSVTGSVAVSLSGATNPVDPVAVTLTMVPSTAAASPPFGSFDTPAGDATVLAGSVALTGWTLDNIGVKQVELWRDLQPGETTPPGNTTAGDPRNGKIFIANGTFVDNARPDIEGLYPATPANFRGGWGYLMLTWGLFGQGNGTYKFYAFGVDYEGNTSTIGSKTVVISNNAATKPFGSIDTPAIGGDASGPNFGWGLTPKVNGAATCTIQPSGVQYSIDSGPLQPVVYGDARTDIAGAFPGFSNTAAAGGHAIIDWNQLTNGTHTIGWLITDDCNRADGVGSRFFNVTTGTNVLAAPLSSPVVSAFRRNSAEEEPSAVLLARGYGELPEIVDPDAAGSRTIEVKQGERIELRLPRGFDRAQQLGGVAQERALPIGSSWDASAGIFYWQPAPGFLGPFRLVFSNGRERISVRVVVTPSGD